MANYTTEPKVRSDAWFEGNPDVTVTSIGWYIDQANGVVNSSISTRYNITNLSGSLFIGSHAAKFLDRVEMILAAGYLLIKEYWAEDVEDDAAWQDKIEEAMSLLQDIEDWKMRLLDKNWNEFATWKAEEKPVQGLAFSVSWKRSFSVDDEF